MSQTLCNIEVFPAFALPIMSTLNWIFGTRGLGAGGGAGAWADGAGSGGGAGTRAGDGGAGVGAGAGDGEGGPRQQVLCCTPIARKCCEKVRGEKED